MGELRTVHHQARFSWRCVRNAQSGVLPSFLALKSASSASSSSST